MQCWVELWAVPKKNFASGLPADIEDAMVPEESIMPEDANVISMMLLHEELPCLRSYYIIDTIIPESRLGTGVVKLRLRGGGLIPGCSSSAALNHFETSARALPQAAPPLEHSKPLGVPVPPTKRFQRGVLGDPLSKKPRLLYEALAKLQSNITNAANHGNWSRASEWDHDNVVDHMNEMMQLLCLIREDSRKDFDFTGNAYGLWTL